MAMMVTMTRMIVDCGDYFSHALDDGDNDYDDWNDGGDNAT